MLLCPEALPVFFHLNWDPRDKTIGDKNTGLKIGARPKEINEVGHLHYGVHWLQLPESLSFCFLVLIRAIVLCSPLGLQNLDMKGKTK